VKNKFFLAILVIALICVLLISCNAITQPESSVPPDTNAPSLPDLSFPDESIYINVSDGDDISDTDVSVPSETSTLETSEPDQTDESTVPEVSTVVEEYIWYGQKELDDWFKLNFMEYSTNEYALDGKHSSWYFSIPGLMISDLIGEDNFKQYVDMFSGSWQINKSAICEYFDITREEYVAYYEAFLEEHGKAEEGVLPNELILWNLDCLRYDAIFSEEYWNHPDFLVLDYQKPEIDDYYTSLNDRGGYTRHYYTIDRKLIEYIGENEFEQWLKEKDDKDQNILEFIKDFNITKEDYSDIYAKDVSEGLMRPYRMEYLFGTPEMQEEYFTVHPLN